MTRTEAPECSLNITNEKRDWSDAFIIAPSSAMNTPWTRRFGDASRAFASGWMTIRGMKRRRNVDRGFALSDHADWPALLHAITAVGPRRCGSRMATLRSSRAFSSSVVLLRARIETRFTGERLEELEQRNA